MNHKQFVAGYRDGSIKVKVNRSSAGYLYRSPSQIPRKFRLRQASIRVGFFGGTLAGIILFFY